MKKLRETMTEQALMIEGILRDNKSASVPEISKICRLSKEEVEFILEQMIYCKMVCKVSPEHYKLTYK